MLPFSLASPNEALEVASWISTEELLVETAKVKTLLSRELLNFKRNQNAEQRRLDDFQNSSLPANVSTPSMGGKFNVNGSKITSKSQRRTGALCTDCRETP